MSWLTIWWNCDYSLVKLCLFSWSTLAFKPYKIVEMGIKILLMVYSCAMRATITYASWFLVLSMVSTTQYIGCGFEVKQNSLELQHKHKQCCLQLSLQQAAPSFYQLFQVEETPGNASQCHGCEPLPPFFAVKWGICS